MSLYSIVMPTRERSDVLPFAIRTVLKQTRPNFELIVMDNRGSSDTRAVVEAFEDPRIRYFRSPVRLSMSENWELGLAHATGDYVVFLGDDDGLMPDAVEVAERLHRERPGQIVNWMPFTWGWPDALSDRQRNRAQMNFGAHADIVESRRLLNDLYAWREYFGRLPTIYCSFVPRQLVETVRSAHGRYLLSAVPDVYSGLANLAYSETFLHVHRPLTTWGVSRHSTGAGHAHNVGQEVRRFDDENRRPWGDEVDPRLSGYDRIVEVVVADVYLKAKEILFPHDREIAFDIAGLLRQLCLRTIAARFHGLQPAFRQAIGEMASKNGLDPGVYLPDFPPDGHVPTVEYRIDARQDVARFAWSTDPATVRTIEEFVDLAARLCVTADAIEIVDSRAGQPPPPASARRVLFDLEAVCAERLALIDSLDRTCTERLEVIGALQRTCDERLELIAALEQTCTERLQLIAELQEACDERLATIRRLEGAARGDQLEVGTASGG